MKLPSLRTLGVVGFLALAAVATALGCPFFRNPGNFASTGGLIGYVRYVVDIHRTR
ncbi:MAG TPA: hypothetical protein VEO96_09405 [Thermoplasmata archaeon]|nr:hypothetical protein [Thermoplasmata archaeon]HYU06970.1 hypothetical protein [Thermoplasmata archaeon]